MKFSNSQSSHIEITEKIFLMHLNHNMYEGAFKYRNPFFFVKYSLFFPPKIKDFNLTWKIFYYLLHFDGPTLTSKLHF